MAQRTGLYQPFQFFAVRTNNNNDILPRYLSSISVAHGLLRIIATADDLVILDWERYPLAENFIDAVIEYARSNNIGRVTVACDVDPFLDEGGIERIKWIYIKAR
jgi:hypothetical protein